MPVSSIAAVPRRASASVMRESFGAGEVNVTTGAGDPQTGLIHADDSGITDGGFDPLLGINEFS